MARITPPKGMTECDRCGGDGVDGQDEDGKWYSCYRCGETGWMPIERLNERPDPDDKHRPDGMPQFQYSPDTGRMVPAPYQRTGRAESSDIDYSDDIPF